MTQRLRSDDRIAFPFGCSAEGRFDRYCSDGSFDLYDFRSDGEKRRSDALDVGVEGSIAVAGTTHHVSTGVLATHFEARLPPQAFNFVGTGRIDGSVARARGAAAARRRRQPQRAQHRVVRARPRSNSRRAGACGAACATQACAAKSNRASPRPGWRWPGRPSRRPCSTPTGARASRAKWHPTCRCTPTPHAPCPRCKAGSSKSASSMRARASSLARRVRHHAAAERRHRHLRRQRRQLHPRHRRQRRHRGIEAQLDTQTGAWRWQASVLLLHARREGSANATLNGLPPPNVPAASLRLQAGYELSARRRRCRPALSHEASRSVLPDDSAHIPAWTRLDLGAKLQQQLAGTTLTWRAGIDNLIDTPRVEGIALPVRPRVPVPAGAAHAAPVAAGQALTRRTPPL